mgnify:CR=1 FL=1
MEYDRFFSPRIIVRPRIGAGNFSIEIQHCDDDLEVVYNGNCIREGAVQLRLATMDNPNYEIEQWEDVPCIAF